MRILPDSPTIEKKKYSILDTVVRCGLSPKKSGKIYLINCPFHNDRTPSLTIYPDKQTWRCYGKCEAGGGDAIDFVKRFHHYSYSQAINWLENNSQVSFNIKWEPPEKPKIVPDEFVLYWHSLMDLEGKRDYFHSRGFEDSFIDQELWGWDGSEQRYVLPVWEGEPGNSKCLGVRKRTLDEKRSKYIGQEGYNQATVWGRYYCQSKTVLAFAGEFDSARAVCDGFPAFSLVNGCKSFEAFPKGWPNLWFPGVENMIVVFDQGEEVPASNFAGVWNSYKGLLKARIFIWPYALNVKDYCEYRKEYSPNHFKLLLSEQRLKV